ncbi:hypothetical protein H6G94_03775 [Nostoc punctiforme FACHB-252]|uniref:Uncharacterized protein n=1 Tax=Nostoc punctiforme FACHB-252 TaxID=1357509 RepID=A0ABR8H5A4_NOSPU|nr:hypothetical protein [Nostoc punctiforme]MBD2610400.1 hypothetical protein [Nostoc punctiforme FACHB-252]
MKKNSEVRIQEQSRRRSASGQNQFVGDSDPPLIVRVASPLGRRPLNLRFGRGAKTPIIQTLLRRSKRSHAAGFTLRYPPVVQNSQAEF